ncbi:hypothetical protein A0257_01970 [Hymenobacter psoromatis]|nr:hypothetical protein A0257_01970 [Hymenobacter psoromatis]
MLINAAYLVAMLMLTIYWSVNFTAYSHSKGDESFFFIELTLGLAYIVFIANALFVKCIGWLAALVIPLLACGVAVVMTFVLVLWLINGYPAQLIIGYGISYSIVTFGAIARSAYRWGLLAL